MQEGPYGSHFSLATEFRHPHSCVSPRVQFHEVLGNVRPTMKERAMQASSDGMSAVGETNLVKFVTGT